MSDETALGDLYFLNYMVGRHKTRIEMKLRTEQANDTELADRELDVTVTTT